MMGPLAVPTFADNLRAQFFQAGVPLDVLDSPTGGALAMGDFGNTYHFTTQDQVNFFLLGYKLGEQTARPEPLTSAPAEAPGAAEYAGYQKETGE